MTPDFNAYREKSREVWAIVRERLACPLQNMSVDEAYADVTAIDKPLRALRDLVAEVHGRTGITISVGVGPSRLVAKTASDAEKPAGFVVLSREQACERFAGEPARLLQGVGPRTQERLAELGLNTVGDLQAADTDELVARFGERMGRWLKQCAFFHDTSPVQARAAAKSLSSETTFDEDVEDLAALEETIRRLAADVCGGLQRRNMRGRTIGIKVRLDDWTNATRARTIEAWTNDQEAITTIALELLRAYAPRAAGAAARRPRRVLRGRGGRAPLGAGGSARAGGVRRAVAVAVAGGLRRLVAVRRRVDLRVRLGQRLVALRGLRDAAVELVAQLVGVVFGVVAAVAGDDHAGGGRHAGHACEADNLPGHLHGA